MTISQSSPTARNVISDLFAGYLATGDYSEAVNLMALALADSGFYAQRSKEV